jgi:uncharacterized membrane protein YdjX (TVP38/TMEM64 family)
MTQPVPPPGREPPPHATSRAWLVRLAAIAILLVAALSLPLFVDGQQLLEQLAGWEEQLRAFYREHPVITLAAAFMLYVVITGLSLPLALPLSLTYGWLLGFVPAVILVSFASTSGATISFLLSRYLIGQWVQSRFGDRLAWFNEAIEREGAFFLFTLRLVPPVPFWLVNLLAGLTKIRVTTFWWVSQLGMLPATMVFLWAGASAPTLQKIADKGIKSLVDWQIIAALSLVGIFPLVVRLVVGRIRAAKLHGSQPDGIKLP